MERLFLLGGGRFQLGTAIELAAVGVPPHFGGRGYLDTSVGVDAPTLAPLSVVGHVALKYKRGEDDERGGETVGVGGLMKLLGEYGVEALAQNSPPASFGPARLIDPY